MRRIRARVELLETRTVLSTLAHPIVSEFLASNTNGIRDSWGEAEDWIELHNPTPETVELSGWGLTDNQNRPHKWTFPEGVTIGPGEFLIVWASGNDTVAPDGEIHTSFSLAAGGEYLGLSTPDQITVHSYAPEYPPQSTDISYGVAFTEGVPDLDTLLFFETPSPGVSNDRGAAGRVAPVRFSVPHGFYEEHFVVELQTETVGATIRYTTDGSTPRADHGLIYSEPIPVGRTTTLRAGAFKDGNLAPQPSTRTYLFLTDVIHQSADGQVPAGWPETWGNHVVDVGMDPTIVNHPEYGGQTLIAALQAIPSVSLTTDLVHLFDAETGIYANSTESGREWERPVSVELIHPDGSEGFQIDAGLRIRGTVSTSPDNPKHSLRLFFRNDYGTPSLEYPLFGDEGVDVFDKVDLRTAQNYSWSFQGHPDSNFIAEVFARDTMRDLGQPYTRSRFYHLYLNGQYWGLYQTEERPSKEYAASYFGGNEEDYDVVKPDYPTRTVETADGNLDAWQRLWEAATAPGGLGSAEAYYRLQGKNPDGTDNPAYEVLVDVNNLIDYMATIFYIGDIDGPIVLHPFFPDGFASNNWYAIRNRDPEARQGFQFMMRDAESSLLGLREDRTGPFGLGEEFEVFNPQYLHEQLLANPDYVERFQGRAAELLAPGGPLSAEASIARFRARVAEIEHAVVAESARWGDAQRPDAPLTRSDWQNAVDRVLKAYLPYRTVVVINQFRDAGLLDSDFDFEEIPLPPPPDEVLLPPPPAEVVAPSEPPAGHFGGAFSSDLALFRRGYEKGFVVVAFSGGGGTVQTIGRPGDIPISGDFDGDGLADFAVFRPHSDRMPGAAEWIIVPSGGSSAYSVLFGGADGLDLPVAADYTGDGRTDIAVFRPDSDLVPGAAQWFILPSDGSSAYSVLFGGGGGLDVPVPADFDGDGITDIATFRANSDLVPGAAQWFILPSDGSSAYSVLFGGGGGLDVPIPADFDGDGRADIALFRSNSDLVPGASQWFILPSRPNDPSFRTRSGGYSLLFGQGGVDQPVLGDFDGDGHADLAVYRPTTSAWFMLRSTSGPFSTAFGEAGDVPILSPLPYRMPSPVALATTSEIGTGPMVGPLSATRRWPRWASPRHHPG